MWGIIVNLFQENMLQSVATIVAPSARPMPQGLENQAAQAVKALGVDRLEIQTLDNGHAFDVLFSGENANLRQQAQTVLRALGSYDVFVQANDDFRRKKLLLADMDATMIEGETLDDLAAHLGIHDKIAPITAAAMRGEIDFGEALRQRILLLKGLPVAVVMEAVSKVRYSAGAKTAIRTMRSFGARCVLISGGFDMFTSHVAAELGFHKNIANRLSIENEHLTGMVIPPIVDKTVKKNTLEEEARTLGITPLQTMAVGDGANDIPMLQAAGAGVGYFGKPAVQAATPYQIRHSDLTALLYMQGYRKADFKG